MYVCSSSYNSNLAVKLVAVCDVKRSHLEMAAIQGVGPSSPPHYRFLLLWIIFMAIASPVTPEMVYRVDPLALLSGTLRTYQKAGCDMELISLSCPRGTSISIEVAQYGNTVGDGTVPVNICPPSTENTLPDDATHGTASEIELKPPENCLPNALQNVVETCQKKSHCKFLSTANKHDADPCPDKQKFVEVAYKCRPYEFRSKVACENDVIQLVCNPYSRIAIYSASFGRTEYESIQCSQPQGVMEETCLVSYATETVMDVCHGRRRCTVTADSATFGNPCRADSRVYLKVVYTCIPRKVLKERFDYSNEPDEPHHVDMDMNQDDLYDEDQFYRESEAIPPAPKLHRELSKSVSEMPYLEPISSSVNPPPMRSRDGHQLQVAPSSPQSSVRPISHIQNIRHKNNFIPASTSKYPINENVSHIETDCDEEPTSIGFVSDWINAYIFLEKNQEKFYLYLIISVTAGVLLCLVLVIGRLLLQKRHTKKESIQSNAGDTTLPHGFADDISEIDNDIDLTTPLPLPSVSRSDQSYGTYAPSPSPYGHIGHSNVSHTSTTMLVPSNPMMLTPQQHPPNVIGASNALMYSSPNMPPGTMMNANYPPVYIGAGGSIMGHSTLRRPRDYEHTPPRIMSKGDADQQYYYG